MSDLDDFFAKKDKTKKNKKKGLSNDDLNKKFEGPKANEAFKVKKFYNNLEGFIQDEGEWNDFVDDENKDYSGLKIQTLSIKDKEEEQREEEESIKKDQAGTPWSKVEEEGQEAKKEPEKPQDGDDLKSIVSSLFKPRGPKINDTIEFPDLGTPAEAYEDPKGFQPVRQSGVYKANTASQNNESITSDNKYNALRNSSN